ncbi:MAG: pseudouridine synthase [Hyperthermus sp.]|nr:MAG: pseudouridine synthase [Hyperthermus sp.]
MRRWVLSKRDRRRLFARLMDAYPRLSLPGRDCRVEILVAEDFRIYVFDSIPAFIEAGERGLLIPHLKYLLSTGNFEEWLPVVVVDEGAVAPIARGADLMRPGVVEVRGDFPAGAILVIVEGSKGVPLAVHRSLYASRDMIAMSRGRVAESLHHVGDRFWAVAGGL